MEATRVALAELNATHGGRWYLELTMAQAQDIASGYVPTSVRAMALFMLDCEDEDRRRADRPVPTRKGKMTA